MGVNMGEEINMKPEERIAKETRQEIEAREAEMTIEEAMEIAKSILSALAQAFGGFSQVKDEVVGLALLGQANNNHIPPRPIAREIAFYLADRWEADEDVIYGVIAVSYNTERGQLGWHHTPELPPTLDF
jgi:hypothetical protein